MTKPILQMNNKYIVTNDICPNVKFNNEYTDRNSSLSQFLNIHGISIYMGPM